MASVYGYSQSLSEGSAFNARVAAHNDLVQEHNNKVLGDYNTAVKQQTRDAADDKDTVEEDAAIDGTEDGKGLLQAAYGSYKFGQDIATAGGVGAAFAKQSAERQGAIKSTFKRLGDGEVKKAAKTDLSSAAGDSAAAEGAASDAADAGDAAAGTSAAAGAGDAAAAARTASAAGAATTAAADTAGTAAGDATRAAGAAGTAAEDLAGAAGGASEVTEIGSSGLGAAVIKGGLAKLGVGKLVGEAGLSTLSEVGGKAAGDFGGITDAVEGLVNLGQKKSFFGNDDTAKKWGDSFQMAGAAMDVVGTAFPPLELLGGATGLIGGIIDGIDGLSKDEKKKQSDAAPITDPTKDPSGAGIQQMQVSPAFQSLGLIASAPVSAKMSITGSSGAF